jgi:hypothetical protein
MQPLTLKTKFCLVMVVIVLTICHAGHSKNIVIVRGERDKFTNIFSCNVSNAVCSDESCADCQCMMDQTFVWTRGQYQYGKCVSNELIVYATCKYNI